MTRLLLAASLLLLAAATHAQAVRVAVWHGREPRAFEAYTWAGGYALTDADGRVLDTLRGTWNIAREGATWRIGPHALDGGCLSPSSARASCGFGGRASPPNTTPAPCASAAPAAVRASSCTPRSRTTSPAC